MKISIRQVVLLIICTAMALAVILGLLFNVIGIKTQSLDAQNGFRLLSFSTTFLARQGFAVFSGIINTLILVGGTASIILLILSFLGKGRPYFQIIVIIIAMTAGVLYLMEGCVFVSLSKDDLMQIGYISYAKNLYTASYFPLIIQSVLLIGYLICNKCIRDIPFSERKKEIVTSDEFRTMTERVTLLKQYKELLDDGVITQEEYDAKKKELL